MANDGTAFVVSDLSGCSGSTPAYLYDQRAYTLLGQSFNASLYNGIVGGSADGSRLYAGQNGLSPAQPITVFNSLDDSVTDNQTVTYNLSAVSVSGNASRVILQETDVYSVGLTITGTLPGSAGAALASRDSSRAYVYRDDAPGGPRLDIYNLNGALQSDAVYPLLKTVNLADAPNYSTGFYNAISMAETPDGKTVFVSGNLKVLVVPVN